MKRKVRSVKGRVGNPKRAKTPKIASNKARNKPPMRVKAKHDAIPKDQMLQAMRED